MIEAAKLCPVCTKVLVDGHRQGLTTFECPDAHGVGINLIEANSHLQRDELDAIWSGAYEGHRSELNSPVSNKPMIEVTFLVDDDLNMRNLGANSREMTIEVDIENYFGWFSFEELKSMPTDMGLGIAPGMVSMDHVDLKDSQSNRIFDSLSEEDYELQRSTSGGFFSGLVRRLRSS